MQYSEEIIQAVWEKALPTAEVDPRIARQDTCGAWIKRSRYEDRESAYGWSIDRIQDDPTVPLDHISNLRPLHWQNKESKKDGVLTCPIQAKGHKNAVKKAGVFIR